MEEAADQRRLPWRRTVAVQVALCLALYAAFSLGEPQLRPRGGGAEAALGRAGRGPGGVSFLSVAGGARPPAEQAHLLRQTTSSRSSWTQLSQPKTLHCLTKMEIIAKVYEVKFVLNVGQFGEEDPLWQNGSLYFQALKIPWYSTTSSHGQIVGNFLKKVKMPYDQVLEIIGVDTGPLQEPLHDGKISTSYREQIEWLEQSLTVTSSNWKIAAGYNPLVVCKAHTPETTKLYEPLQRIFVKYEVNAYLSTGGFCGYFRRDNSMLYAENPSPGDQTNVDGFLLHRVGPLEMESLLINLQGKIVQRSVVHQHGRGAL